MSEQVSRASEVVSRATGASRAEQSVVERITEWVEYCGANE